MADYGIKISKTGNDVLTALDRSMIMTSKYPMYKAYSSGTGSMTKSGGNSSKYGTITHSLGYIPICFVFGYYVDQSGGTVIPRYKLFSWRDTPGLGVWDYYSYDAGTQNLVIGYTTDYWIAETFTFNYQYHIFYDEKT